MPSGIRPRRHWLWGVLGLAFLVSLAATINLWQRLGKIQAQLARQNQEASQISQEARVLARNAADVSVQSTAKLAVMETRLNELVAQKAQVDEMLLSLTRSRVENLVLDLEASMLLAQQQAQLTGSVEPLMAALISAQQRMARAPSPRLQPLDNAMRRDLERLRSTRVMDAPVLLVRLEELVRLADETPLAGAVFQKTGLASGQAGALGGASAEPKKAAAPAKAVVGAAGTSLWQDALTAIRQQWESLVRVQRIEHPEAVLLSPEQAFFVRENLKLKLLNARMGILARQFDTAKGDVTAARQAVERYFDVQSKSGQLALGALEQIQAQLASSDQMPGIDETLNAAAALTGRK